MSCLPYQCFPQHLWIFASAIHQKFIIIVQSHTAAPLRQSADLVIRQIPEGRTYSPCVGMACHEGLLRTFPYIVKAGIRQMGDVRDHSETLHLCDKIAAGFRQTTRRVPAIGSTYPSLTFLRLYRRCRIFPRTAAPPGSRYFLLNRFLR